MFDAVLVYHTNPLACGVTKFSEQLAKRLDVPCEPLSRAHRYKHPLTSVKSSEIHGDWLNVIPDYGDLLLHDRPGRLPMHRRIFYADELGCPSTIEGNPSRGVYRVLTFGMGNKRILHHYVDLKIHLDATQPDYTLEMSTAIHEGTPWDEGLQQSIRDMRAIFGDRLRVLGFLSDDAIAKELQECDAVAVYFTPALRRNNTTYWAAVAAGKTVFTNTDSDSPTVNQPPTWASVIAQLGATVTTTPSVSLETRSESPDDRTDPPADGAIAHPSPSL